MSLITLQIVVLVSLMAVTLPHAAGCFSKRIEYVTVEDESLEVHDVGELVQTLKGYKYSALIEKLLDSIFKTNYSDLYVDFDREAVKKALEKDGFVYDYECSKLNFFLKPLVESCPYDIQQVTRAVRQRMKEQYEINLAYGAALACSALAELRFSKNPTAGHLDNWKFWGNLY